MHFGGVQLVIISLLLHLNHEDYFQALLRCLGYKDELFKSFKTQFYLLLLLYGGYELHFIYNNKTTFYFCFI